MSSSSASQKAVQHILGWNFIKPYIKDLLDEYDMKEYDDDDVDLSYSNLLRGDSDDEICEILSTLLNEGKMSFDILANHGDVIRFPCDYRDRGIYIIEKKENVYRVLPFLNNGDYSMMPTNFPVGVEFPINHWTDTAFGGYTHSDFYLDDRVVLTFLKKIPAYNEDFCGRSDGTIYSTNSSLIPFVFVVSLGGDELKDTTDLSSWDRRGSIAYNIFDQFGGEEEDYEFFFNLVRDEMPSLTLDTFLHTCMGVLM